MVVVVVDDLRFDEFGAAGHSFLETPNIDRLASEGAWFRNSFHAVPLCSPNRATLLTGQYPSRHGIIDNVARNLASHRLDDLPAGAAGGRLRNRFPRQVAHHPELDELYDLEADPFEMTNLVDDPSAASIRAELREELGRLVLEAMNLGPEG